MPDTHTIRLRERPDSDAAHEDRAAATPHIVRITKDLATCCTNLDVASLSQLIQDHSAGKLEQICQHSLK
jgi:hypothetical protein